MKATFRITDPRLLLEASVGELFVPLGPELVECVCAMRSHTTSEGVQLDMTPDERRNPDTLMPVIVVACRAEPGDPEYYPAGFETVLSGASPIVFVHPLEPLQLAPVEERGKVAEDLTARHNAEALDHLRQVVRGHWDVEITAGQTTLGLAPGPSYPIDPTHRARAAFNVITGHADNLARPELISKL